MIGMEISKLRTWLGAGVVVGALAIGGGLGLAQDTPPGDPAGQPVAPPAATPPAGTPPAAQQTPDTPDDNVQQVMTKKADVPAAQMTANADGYLVKMREVLKRVVQLQGIAHKQK